MTIRATLRLVAVMNALTPVILVAFVLFVLFR